jgi:FkbM family methyltransferase
MQQTVKPKGLAKIWREVMRPFRQLCKQSTMPEATDAIVQNALNCPEFVEKLWGKNNFVDGDSTRQTQRERSEFFRTVKPEELKSLQNRLVANTDELSGEVVARWIIRSHFCLELENTNVPFTLRKAAWNTFSKLLCTVQPLDCKEQKHIKTISEAYHCPYKLPSFFLSPEWKEHMAIDFGLNQFPQEVQKRLIGKDIIDGGSCAGDSAMIFTEYAPKKVYAFEANPDTVPAMKKVFEENTEVLGSKKNLIEVVPMALGSSKGKLTLFSRGEFDGAATTVPRDYKTKAHEVDVISIDEFVEERLLNVGLIKLDVEGAEYDTILGAKETIMKQKPILIISIYHSVKDFFEIKPLLESWGVGYKFYIRHHVLSAPDTEFALMAY